MSIAIRARLILCTISALMVLPLTGLVAQDNGVVLDFGDATVQPATTGTIPDSVIQRALAIFNAPPPATSRTFGGTSQVVAPQQGNYGVFGGDLLLRSRIAGSVVVVNGDLRVTADGRIDGDVIVLGGRFSADSGALITGTVTEYRQRASIRRAPDGTLEATEPPPSLRELAGKATLRLGRTWLSPRVGIGGYNRVEGFPVRLGAGLLLDDPTGIRLRADGDLIVRTALDPSDVRSTTGWWARASARIPGAHPLTLGVEAAHQIEPLADQPFSNLESSLSALFLRRDYRDWMRTESARIFGSWQATPQLVVHGRATTSRQRSVAAVQAFSLLRSDETWRPNTLIDDGRFLTFDLGAAWNTRGVPGRPSSGWTISAGVSRTSSDELTPLQLPDQVRDPLPSEGYASWQARFSIHREQRLDPYTTLAARFAGIGWLAGDPLTVQQRLALPGGDILPGYRFREFRCDPRRRPDPSLPALCDRQMAIQVELRRVLNLRIGTDFGPYSVGIDQPELVVFGDLASAWIAGDGPGQVPTNRIQQLSEWRGDFGVGLDAGWIGAYLARSFTDDRPVRLVFRLQQRF